MNEAGGEHGAGRPDRVAMGNGAAFDVDDVLRQSEFACNDNGDGCEGLVDLDPIHRVETSACTIQRLLDGRDRAEAEHAGLDRGNAVGDELGRRRDATPSAHVSSASTIAAAPVFTPGALPAVIVPPSRKAGFSAANASSVVPGRLCSSASNAVGPLRPDSSTGTISALNLPEACAALKRCCERSAH